MLSFQVESDIAQVSTENYAAIDVDDPSLAAFADIFKKFQGGEENGLIGDQVDVSAVYRSSEP